MWVGGGKERRVEAGGHAPGRLHLVWYAIWCGAPLFSARPMLGALCASRVCFSVLPEQHAPLSPSPCATGLGASLPTCPPCLPPAACRVTAVAPSDLFQRTSYSSTLRPAAEPAVPVSRAGGAGGAHQPAGHTAHHARCHAGHGGAAGRAGGPHLQYGGSGGRRQRHPTGGQCRMGGQAGWLAGLRAGWLARRLIGRLSAYHRGRLNERQGLVADGDGRTLLAHLLPALSCPAAHRCLTLIPLALALPYSHAHLVPSPHPTNTRQPPTQTNSKH